MFAVATVESTIVLFGGSGAIVKQSAKELALLIHFCLQIILSDCVYSVQTVPNSIEE